MRGTGDDVHEEEAHAMPAKNTVNMTVIIQAPFSTFRADRTINKKLALVLVPGFHRHFEIEKKEEKI